MATMTKSEKTLTRFEFLFNKYVNLEKWMSSELELHTNYQSFPGAYETIAPKVNVADFFTIILFDPTTRLNGISEAYVYLMLESNAFDLIKMGGKIKVGEYSEWLIKQFLNADSNQVYVSPSPARETLLLRVRFIEDLYKVKENLTKFHRFKNRLTKHNRDINKLTVGDLEFLMLDYSLEKTKASAEEKDAAKAYNEKAQELSEYFKLNEISDDESDDVVAKDETNPIEEEVAKDDIHKKDETNAIEDEELKAVKNVVEHVQTIVEPSLNNS